MSNSPKISHSKSKLFISLNAIKNNYQRLQKQLGGADCGAVIKANAYGLGVEPVALALQAAGCETFFVAHLEEGMELREILPEAEIYVFHGVQKNEFADFAAYNLIPVLNNPAQLENWDAEYPAAAHIDTGMTRLGFDINEVELLHGQNLCLLMTHLACAELPRSPSNYAQIQYFDKVAQQFPHVRRSVANSYGIYLGKEFHANLARPGLAIYGGNPTPAKPNPMENVIRITAPILQINRLADDSSIGYGATYMAKKGDVVATLAIGYADGLMRSLSNKGKCYIQNFETPIIGRVSMDLVTVDISNVPEIFHKVGQDVEIIGNHYTIADAARAAGTIEYEILTMLGNRFERIYK
jgi:alanine racemase